MVFGGLIQLAARGFGYSDIYLTGNPEMTFFPSGIILDPKLWDQTHEIALRRPVTLSIPSEPILKSEFIGANIHAPVDPARFSTDFSLVKGFQF